MGIPPTLSTFKVVVLVCRNCKVSSFEIGEFAQNIGDGALNNPDLESIILDANNEFYKVQDGVLYDYGLFTLLYSPAKSATSSITIPGTVTTIKPYAFQDAKNLTTVVFHSGTLSIGAYAFNGSGTRLPPNGCHHRRGCEWYARYLLQD